MNAPNLELSKQLDRLFLGSLHKIKFHIFQDISKYTIHVLRPFKYNNISELCYRTQDKDKRGEIMTENCFVLHEEVIDIFQKKLYHHYRKIVISSCSY